MRGMRADAREPADIDVQSLHCQQELLLLVVAALVLMRELGIPFRETLVPFGGAQNPDAFRVFSPTGKVPCLVDGDITVWDSLAITEYVGERHAGVWPAGRRRTRLGAQCRRRDALRLPGTAQHLRDELRRRSRCMRSTPR